MEKINTYKPAKSTDRTKSTYLAKSINVDRIEISDTSGFKSVWFDQSVSIQVKTVSNRILKNILIDHNRIASISVKIKNR